MIRVLPGKTNLKKLGYSMVGDFTSDDLAPAWDNADDTSAWIVREEDKKVVGQIDWSEGHNYETRCELDKTSIYLDRLDVWDKRKGYGRAAMNQKHNDWKKRGFDDVTLFPFSGRQGKQESLYNWYQSQGYQKSTKCKQDSDCNSKFDCYLTKTLF